MRRRTNVFIIVFFAIQLLLPVRGFVYDMYETRGRYSWNMYANKSLVRANYYYLTPEGEQVAIDYKDYFNNRSRATLVHHRVTLPKFHAFLCDEVKSTNPGAALYGKVTRKVNDGDERELVRTDVDLCSDPDYGVLPR